MSTLSELVKEKEEVLAKILQVKNAERDNETDMHLAGLTFVLVGIQDAINNLQAKKDMRHSNDLH